MNEDLQNLMSKSKTNQLDSDGLTTLKYKKIQEKNLPLYTWILVDLPKVNNNLKQMVIDNLLSVCLLFTKYLCTFSFLGSPQKSCKLVGSISRKS